MSTAAGLLKRALRVVPPRPCWAWNEEHGRLSARDSSMPGPWRGSVVPYLRHWHDIVTARKLGKRYMGDRDPWAHLTEQVWLVAGTQSAKTRSFLYAGLGYLVDQHPSPKALILPRKKDFKRVLDNRVRPFFKETPKLAEHFPRGRQEEKIAITYEAWTLDVCTIYYLCGEIADDLRSWPICDLFFDEFDLLPLDCEGQGDPIDLALDRQKTWPRTRLSLGATTPTTIDGHGWRRLCSGSHERLLVECPTCHGHQELDPDQLRWQDGASSDEIKTKGAAHFECRFCHALHDTAAKDAMVRHAGDAGLWVPGKWETSADFPLGKWAPRARFDGNRLADVEPAATTIRTGHFNSLYSPFVSLADFAAHHVHAKTKGNQTEWTSHLNGWRCEPLLPQVVQVVTTEEIAKAVVLGYGRGAAPEGQRIVLTLDQQGNSMDRAWFPWVARAFGPGGKSWQIDCGEVHGWDELDLLCARGFTVAGSPARAADVVAMDSANGNMRVAVQNWASREPSRRLLLRGYQVMDVPWRKRGSDSRGKRLLRGVTQYYFDSTAYKNSMNDRVHGTAATPPWFLPQDVPDFMLRSLTSEEQVPEKKRVPNQGWREVMVWQPRAMYDERGGIVLRTDTHWWDCETMALVVADIKEWGRLIELPKDDGAAPPRTEPAGDWVGGGDGW